MRPLTGRRVFIGTLAGGLLAAPLAVEAQQARREDTDRDMPRSVECGWLN
jgi:hypothetical protein